MESQEQFFEFSMRTQKWAASLSLGLAIAMLSLGSTLLGVPGTMMNCLLHCAQAHDSNPDIEQVIKSVARMIAGLLIAQGLSCVILLVPCLQVPANCPVNLWKIYLTRISISMQSVTGLCWIIVGLIDDQMVKDGPNGQQRKKFGLLIVGFSILVLSSLALMFSFWSIDSLAAQWPAVGQRANSQEGQLQDNLITEPLLARSEEHEDNTLENGPAGTSDASTNLSAEPLDEIEEAEESTSRVRGTRRLLKLAQPQVLYLYIGCITLLIRLPFSLCIPHFVSTTLVALTEGDFHKGRHEVFWLFLLGSIDSFLDFWCVFWFGYSNLRIVRGVRIDTFAAILRQDIGFFDKHTSGELASRLSSDCGAMASDLTWFFRFSIESVVRIVGITTYMMIRSPRLASCALSIVPIVAAVNKLYGDWLSVNSRKVQDALAGANAVAQETISCVRTVIAFAAEQLEHDKYVEKIDEQYRLNVKQTYLTGVYYMFISTFLINTVVQGTLLLFGSFLIQHGRLTGDVILAFMLYQGQLQNEMMNLFQSYSSLIKSSGAGDKVFALLDRRPPPPATGSASVMMYALPASAASAAMSIELRDLSFSYPSRPTHEVLMGLNLTVHPGQTIALVGPSGCGKSTIASLLQRFYDPVQGAIFVDGIDLRTLDIKGHRARIGVVTQDPILLAGSILSNITYGVPGATVEQAIEAAKMANAHNFIVKFPQGYDTEVGERGVQLSGGQKQRLAIARAVIRNPSLLLLDEATSALDAESEQVVQAALDNLLSQSVEITTIVIAHRLGTVRNANAIAVMNDGKIVEFGDHDELMKSETGFYRDMVQKSMGNTLAIH